MSDAAGVLRHAAEVLRKYAEPVSQAVAALLEDEAPRLEHHHGVWAESIYIPDADAHVEMMFARPLAVARAVLGIQPPPPTTRRDIMTTDDPKWVKACDSSSCVEVAPGPPGSVLIRASAAPEDTLLITEGEWREFTAGVVAGKFNAIPGSA